ncbi:hypothetical protein Droror1_Dr00011853 [Drosera rotundifolia]
MAKKGSKTSEIKIGNVLWFSEAIYYSEGINEITQILIDQVLISEETRILAKEVTKFWDSIKFSKDSQKIITVIRGEEIIWTVKDLAELLELNQDGIQPDELTGERIKEGMEKMMGYIPEKGQLLQKLLP